MNTPLPDDIIGANARRILAQLRQHAAANATQNITLIAVSKTFPAQAVRAAAAAGITDIGENYLQEAEQKTGDCADLPLTWHFIGKIQKNKTARIARLFSWAHGVDNIALAERLSEARLAADMPPLNIFIQVNISREAGKSGVAEEDAAALASAVSSLKGVHLRGLMALPAPSNDDAEQRAVFRRVALLQQNIIKQTGIALDCLSMGMSNDYIQALAAGATHVRIGSGIFGAREYKGAEGSIK